MKQEDAAGAIIAFMSPPARGRGLKQEYLY